MDLNSFYKMTYGLYVVSAKHNDWESGCIVNTLSQVTAEPVRLSVSISKESFTAELIRQSGRFTGVALDQSADFAYIGRFGFRTGRDFAKFDGISVSQDSHHIPYPTDHTAAFFSVKVEETVDLGTHWLFVGTADEGEILSRVEPMTYTYYRTVIKGFTPKNAPSYHAN